jgi:prevent-host-death family protein
MKEMTASEASRNFSALLDEAEHGETFLVTRNGRRAVLIAPAPRANGRALNAVFDVWEGRAGVDDEFVDGVESIRDAASPELDGDPWRD